MGVLCIRSLRWTSLSANVHCHPNKSCTEYSDLRCHGCFCRNKHIANKQQMYIAGDSIKKYMLIVMTMRVDGIGKRTYLSSNGLFPIWNSTGKWQRRHWHWTVKNVKHWAHVLHNASEKRSMVADICFLSL